MIASYRRGYIVRITASGSLRAKGRMARTPTTTSSTRIPRLRRARDLPYLRLLPWVVVESPLPRDLASEFVRLLSKSIQISVISYRQVGPPGLVLSGVLPRLYGPQRRVVQATLLGPRSASRFRDRDRYCDVVVLTSARLEQQRNLHDKDLRRRGLDTPVGLATDQWMQYLFEVPQCPCVTEHLAAEGIAVYAVRSSNVFSETFDDPGDGLEVTLEEVMHDLIGRGRLRARQFT